jgi:hypothetical protein
MVLLSFSIETQVPNKLRKRQHVSLRIADNIWFDPKALYR